MGSSHPLWCFLVRDRAAGEDAVKVHQKPEGQTDLLLSAVDEQNVQTLFSLSRAEEEEGLVEEEEEEEELEEDKTSLQSDCYTEKCVMNNYFGIGLDAKISLDFNNKRDEHPEKCRSRTKNMMWYGVLGTKELLHRTYKNLEQRVLLEVRHTETDSSTGVKITVLGDEGVPVQVDGEAWVQPPGYIRIIHKNRTQTLTRDRAFESTLKSWEDKQKCEFPRTPPPQPPLSSHPEMVSEEDASLVSEFGQAAGALIHSIREVAQSHHSLEQELAHAVNASSKAMDVVYANSKGSGALGCSVVLHMVGNVKALLSETELLLAGKMSMLLDPPQQEQLNAALTSVSQQLRRLADVPWLCPVVDPSDHEENHWGVASGWGLTRFMGRSSRFLRKVALPVVSYESCRASTEQVITDNMFCAGYLDDGVDACSGDSGGPFVVNYRGTWFLTGVISWGEKCAADGKYGVYTRLGNFLDWMRDTMERLDPRPEPRPDLNSTVS
ncbi:hypothetical protein F2P81_017763 [Scophthalmus maximus]|uniref:Vitamin K-dependent protein C n=1 Tax=Scophthalmus maximus TaxID=52904 RepID=A0A6A4SL16_SCOMX|nr:hypothetical protein F2P81_017763 [Scophthalmus maximus]